MLGFFVPFAFKSPWLLLFLLLVPVAIVLYLWLDRRREDARRAWSSPRTDAEHGRRARPAGAATSRRSCSRSRSRCSSSVSRGPRRSSPRRRTARRSC